MILLEHDKDAVIASLKSVSLKAGQAFAKAAAQPEHEAILPCIAEIEEELHTVRLILLGCNHQQIND